MSEIKSRSIAHSALLRLLCVSDDCCDGIQFTFYLRSSSSSLFPANSVDAIPAISSHFMTKMRKSVTDLYKKVIVYCLMTVKMTVDLLSCRHKGDRETQARDLDIGTEVGKMKSKFRNRAVAMTLAMIMTAAPVWGAAYAADEAAGQAN